MDVFKLCKRKRLSESEKQRLLASQEARNKLGESVLHNYAKHDGFDEEFMEAFLQHGHDIHNTNKQGMTMLHSCYTYCNGDQKYPKLRWLLEHGCPHSSAQVGATEFFLASTHFYGWHEKFFLLLKQLHARGALQRDLRDARYSQCHPIRHCSSVAMFQWFDTHFSLSYDFTRLTYVQAGTTATTTPNPLLQHLSDFGCTDVAMFALQKAQQAGHSIAMITTEWWSHALWRGDVKSIDRLHLLPCFTPDFDASQAWYGFVHDPHLLERNTGCIPAWSKQRSVFLWGLCHGAIQKFPEALVNSLCVTCQHVDAFLHHPPDLSKWTVDDCLDDDAEQARLPPLRLSRNAQHAAYQAILAWIDTRE